MPREFSYTIRLVIQNSTDGSLFYITKTFNDSVDVGPNDYYVSFPISPSRSDEELKKELEQYAADNNLDITKLQVITKEIATSEDDIDIYFEEQDDNTHEYNPNMNVEFIPTVFKPLTPEFFRGYQETQDSITWSWELVSGCAYMIVNDDGDVVANIGEGTFRWIEIGVVPGNYCRRIIAYNADGDSDPSEFITIEVSEQTEIEAEKPGDKPNDYTSEAIEVIPPFDKTLDAFKSGIGDGHDLYTEKTGNAVICERFNIESNIEAFNMIEQRLYTPIEVEYFIKATGEEIHYGDPDSMFQLRIVPWPVENIMFSVYSVVSEPISFEVEYELDVFYQTRRSPNAKIELKGCKELPKELPVGIDLHIVLRDENGDIPDNDVLFTTTSPNAIIAKNGKLLVSAPGDVEIRAFYRYYNISISRSVLFTTTAETPTFSMADDYEHIDKYTSPITSGYRIARKIVPYKKRFTINGIKEYEELTNLEVYIRNSDNDILSSPLNTIEVVQSLKLYGSNDDIQTTISKNTVYVTTRQNERIYVYRKTHRAKLSIDQKSSLRILDPNTIMYKNKYNVSYSGNIAPKTTIDYISVPQSVTIYDDDGNINPTSFADKKPSLNASIDTPSINTIVSGSTSAASQTSLFALHTMFDKNVLPADEYVLEIVELKIDGEVAYTTSDSDTSVTLDGNKFIHISNNASATLSVGGIKTKTIVPFVKESPKVECIVNGKKPYVYDYDGKANYIENAPVFVYDCETQNVEYEAILFNKAQKRVDAEFENGHKYRCTKRNGDVLIISSGDYEIVNIYKKQLVSHSISEEYELNSETGDVFETYIYNPLFNNAAKTAELDACELSIKTSNPNIAITTDIKTIDFTLPEYKDTIKVPITITAKIISVSQTSWSPVINSGYYYINNHEYYLYGESNLTGVFCKEERPVERNFFASVIANIESKTNALPIIRLLSGATSFAPGVFTSTIVDEGNITLAYRMIGGKRNYYDEGEYITDDIILGSELNNISIKFDGEYLDNIKCYVSTNNGVTWTTWMEIPNEFRIDTDEYIQKFKIKFVLSRLVDQEIDYAERTSIYTEGDFKANGFKSENVIIQTGLITQDNVSKVGSYESPPYDVKEDSTYIFVEPQSLSTTSGKYELYIALNNQKDFTGIEFIRATDRVAVGNYKYYKYRIVFPINSKVGFNTIDTVTYYTSTSQVSVSPAIKSIETSSIPKEWIFAGTIKKPLLCTVKADTMWRYVTDHNIMDMIYPDIAIAGIKNPRVQDVIVELMDNDIEIKYDLKKDGRIAARTKSIEKETVDSKYINIDKDYIGYITPVPKLGAPVVMMYGEIALININSYDEDGELTNVITECAAYHNNNVLTMSYNNIDKDSVVVKCGEDNLSVTDVGNNKIIIDDQDIDSGSELIVTYKVKYSFGVDMQYSNDMAKVTVHLEHDIEPAEYNKIKAYCETSDTGLYNASEVEINPMYNVNHTGFVYLHEDKAQATRIEIVIDKTDFKATTPEDVYFTARVVDDMGNPIPYVPVRVTTIYGKIKMISNVTNTSGIITAKYIHPNYQCDDTISVSIGDTKIKDSVDVRVDKDSKFIILNANVEDSAYVINNGERITILTNLYEDNLAPMVGKEIVVEMLNENGDLITKNALTDINGRCTFDVTPVINTGLDKCHIVVSYLSVVSNVYVKVVDKS